MSPDVIVVGLGAMGAATLYRLARRGIRAIGIDRFSPPHDRGSSHGESRITRQAIGEGEAYVPFALRSHEIWRELEADTGQSLLVECGGLIIGRRTDGGIHGHADFIGRTIAAADRFAIPHEVLTADETRRRFPQFRLDGDETCYYERGAGFVRPEACVAAQLDRARALGATIRTGEVVRRLTGDAAGVTLTTDSGTLSAGHVVVTAGAWSPQIAGASFARLLRVYRQTMFWFAPDEAGTYAPERFPIFIWRYGAGENDHFYGFPVVADGVKVATEQFAEPASPDAAPMEPTPEDARRMHGAHVRDRLAGLGDRCLSATTCLYTVTPDFGFLIDRHPEWDRVIVASPCSGHGFKHSAAIGEALAELVVDGRSRFDLAPFSMRRFLDRGGAKSFHHEGHEGL
jgi:sarcosine oxidase